MNIHDEVLSVTRPDKVDEVSKIVSETVESYRELIPLVGMVWNKDMKNWAEKSGSDDDDNNVHITYDKEAILKDIS